MGTCRNLVLEIDGILKRKIVTVAGMVLSAMMVIYMAEPLKATSIQGEKNKQEKLHEEIENAQQILEELEQLKEDTTAYIAEMDIKMEELTNYIVELNSQIEAKVKEIKEINEELSKQQKDIDLQYEAMKKRIKYLYENGQTEYLDMLLNSGDMSELLNKAEYLSKITEYDRNMFEKLKNAKEKVEYTKNTLEQEKKNLFNLKDEAQKEQEEIEVLVEAKAQLLLETDEKIESTQTDLESMEGQLAASIAIEQELEEQEMLYKQWASNEEYSRLLSSSFSGEKFRWPLKGYYSISSGFVHRINPVTNQPENHSGIDIPAPAGTPVSAAADGVVAWANRSGTAGNWVGVDHGNGVMTVYMHMSGFNCEPGDVVKTGDTIGFVGSTGQSTGNHLHFSVRIDGLYVNPINFFG